MSKRQKIMVTEDPRRSANWRRIPGTEYAISKTGVIAHRWHLGVMRPDPSKPDHPSVRITVNGVTRRVSVYNALGTVWRGHPEEGKRWTIADRSLPLSASNLVQVTCLRGRRPKRIDAARFKGDAA